MAYFNGKLGSGRNYAPTTELYCDTCAEEHVPLTGTPGNVGRHWRTDFKWAPHYGDTCHACKKPC